VRIYTSEQILKNNFYHQDKLRLYRHFCEPLEYRRIKALQLDGFMVTDVKFKEKNIFSFKLKFITPYLKSLAEIVEEEISL